MRLLLLAVLVPSLAVAQPDRDLAKLCSKPTTDEDFAACGRFFFDAFNQAPTAAGADEQLYNAGVMFTDAHAISAALNAFALLRKSFPTSRLVAKALARTAKLYGDIVMFDKAADALEEYATKYAGEKDAYAAASDAIYYRRGIGDDDKAIQQTKYFIRTFGAKRPVDAAAAMFSLTGIYEKRNDSDGAIKNLQDYVRQFGAKGGHDRLVIAYGKIGQLLWETSCPVKPIDGVCAKRDRKRRSVCNDARVAVEPVARDERVLKDALAAFTTAIKIFESNPNPGGDEAGARYYYARALLARVDIEAEATPLPHPPRGNLDGWTTAQVAARGKLQTKYERVIAVKDVSTAIAASARIARLSDDLAGAILGTAAKPADCKALGVEAAPFDTNATRLYAACLTKASEVGWFDDDARSCEAALARLAPDEFPPLRELVGASPNNANVVVVSGP